MAPIQIHPAKDGLLWYAFAYHRSSGLLFVTSSFTTYRAAVAAAKKTLASWGWQARAIDVKLD